MIRTSQLTLHTTRSALLTTTKEKRGLPGKNVAWQWWRKIDTQKKTYSIVKLEVYHQVGKVCQLFLFVVVEQQLSIQSKVIDSYLR